MGLLVPRTRRVYVYMHASVFSMVVLENVWLKKYIYVSWKGFLAPFPKKKKSSANWNYIYFGIHMYEPSLAWWICNSHRLLGLWQTAARSTSIILGTRNPFQTFHIEQHPNSLFFSGDASPLCSVNNRIIKRMCIILQPNTIMIAFPICTFYILKYYSNQEM